MADDKKRVLPWKKKAEKHASFKMIEKKNVVIPRNRVIQSGGRGDKKVIFHSTSETIDFCLSLNKN